MRLDHLTSAVRRKKYNTSSIRTAVVRISNGDTSESKTLGGAILV
jgi:hypothetical protein